MYEFASKVRNWKLYESCSRYARFKVLVSLLQTSRGWSSALNSSLIRFQSIPETAEQRLMIDHAFRLPGTAHSVTLFAGFAMNATQTGDTQSCEEQGRTQLFTKHRITKWQINALVVCKARDCLMKDQLAGQSMLMESAICIRSHRFELRGSCLEMLRIE